MHRFCLQLYNLTENFLDLIVEDQHKSAASATEYVGQCTLEEGASAFILGNLAPAVQCVLVHNVGLCATRLHHHAPSHGVEWIGQDSREDGDGLKGGRNFVREFISRICPTKPLVIFIKTFIE